MGRTAIMATLVALGTLGTLGTLTGCTNYWGPFPVGLSPVGFEAPDTWDLEISSAMDTWNDLLDNVAAPCRPFVLSQNGYPVEYVPLDKWVQRDAEYHTKSVMGLTYDDHIEIRGDLGMTDRYYTLVHELGHAMGLSHSDDPTSIMFNGDVRVEPNKQDVADALMSLRGHGDCGGFRVGQ